MAAAVNKRLSPERWIDVAEKTIVVSVNRVGLRKAGKHPQVSVFFSEDTYFHSCGSNINTQKNHERLLSEWSSSHNDFNSMKSADAGG